MAARNLLIERTGCFTLSVDEPVHFSRPAIDVLFESAAEALGAAVTGVLLTGASEDGAFGVTALRVGPIDHVLPQEEHGRFLAQLSESRVKGSGAP